jgi:hypothetical protein
MIELVLAVIAALLWGGAYGAYFGPDLSRWWRRSRHDGRSRPAAGFTPPPQRPRAARARAAPLARRAVAPVSHDAETSSGTNVIPFPRRPKPERHLNE